MRFLFIMAMIAIVTLVGCTTPPVERAATTGTPPTRSAIVRTAAELVGARTITSKGRRIASDCAGVTRAVFLEHGIDLYNGGASDPRDNGVRLIYAHIRQHGRFHRGRSPIPATSFSSTTRGISTATAG